MCTHPHMVACRLTLRCLQTHPINPLNLISRIRVQTKQILRQPFLAYLGLVTNAAAYDTAHVASSPPIASVGWPMLLPRLYYMDQLFRHQTEC